MITGEELSEELIFDDADRESASDSVIDYILNNYDKILAVEVSWQNLEERIAYWLSDDHFSSVLGLLSEDIAAPKTRDDQKNAQKMKSQIAKSVNATLAYAKYEAQLLVLGDDELQESAKERLKKVKEKLYETEDPYKKHFYEIHLEAVARFQTAYAAESDLTTPIYEAISADASQIELIIDFFESDTIDLRDFEGLLYALARNHFDPKDYHLLPAVIEALKSTPSIYQNHFIHHGDMIPEEYSFETRKLISLLSTFILNKAVNGVDGSEVTDFLEDVDFTKLPQGVQDEITAANNTHLLNIQERYLNLISPFNKPKRYLIKNPPVFDIDLKSQDKKRSKHIGSKRTTERIASNISFETGEDMHRRRISTVCFAKKTPEGYIVDENISEYDGEMDLKLWHHLAAEDILKSRCFAGYIARYRNRGDVYNMLRSILKDPIGNGVSPMHAQKVTFVSAKKAPVKKNVLHFSPNDSFGIEFSESTESNRTRIYYFIIDETLVILDIQHKTTSENKGGIAGR